MQDGTLGSPAHHGMLSLAEQSQFDRKTLVVLRQRMEEETSPLGGEDDHDLFGAVSATLNLTRMTSVVRM